MEKGIIQFYTTLTLAPPVPIPYASDLYVKLHYDFLNEYMFSLNFLYLIYSKSVWRGRSAFQFIVLTVHGFDSIINYYVSARDND